VKNYQDESVEYHAIWIVKMENYNNFSFFFIPVPIFEFCLTKLHNYIL